ncbi:DUF3953 domain-containing protein [Peribacillus sp. SI8-4]|uniref:DUF3953 domain-containing protein n=1 Tax=Peribacillus sp. SI8-4 TaxID=3048009 RepID=UPI0025554C04|nr:DUF3953 domain-containing protein [Peribacillus sp. SI8-4]
MNKIKMMLAIVILAISAYQLLTETFVMPSFMLIVGAFMLVTGIVELQKNRKGGFYGCVVVSFFLFFVSIQGFLLN